MVKQQAAELADSKAAEMALTMDERLAASMAERKDTAKVAA